MVLLTSVLAGCQQATTATPPASGATSPTAGSSQPIQSTVPRATVPEGTPTAEPPQTPQPSVLLGDVELGPGTFFLPDPRTGLSDLSSYKETLNVSFEGTKDGQPHHWSKVYVFTHNKEPAGSLLTIDSSGDAVPEDPDALAEASGAFYESRPDGSCTGNPIEPENSAIAFQEPAGLLPGLLGAEEAGSEAVNEVAASHYVFDERAMAEAGRAETDGEIWVAADGGYVLKYVRTTTATAAYFGDGVAGTITWDYELAEINQPQEIVLPPGCQVDAPTMPDAVNVLILPDWMGFDTPSSVADVTAFYQEQLPDQGWTISSDPLVGEGNSLTMFAKGADVLNILVNTGDNGTRVDILLTTAAE
jgi:hypothetical protein